MRVVVRRAVKCSCVDSLEKSVLENLKRRVEEITERVARTTADPTTKEAALSFWKAGTDMIDAMLKLPECSQA